MPELGFSFNTPFEEASRVLENKAVRGLSQDQLDKLVASAKAGSPDLKKGQHWDWKDTLEHQHGRSFVIAKMAQTDLLLKMHESLIAAHQQGWSYSKWAKQVTPQLKEAGWWGKKEAFNPKTGKMEMVQLGSPRRLQVIFRTNMRTSMMAAHYQRLKGLSDMLPMWRYVAVMDRRTRPAHSALNNLVFRHDHDFWDTHFPPNGWGCRCTVTAESDGSLASLTDEIESANRAAPVGQREQVPQVIPNTVVPDKDGAFRGVTPDLGWSYNPGSMPWVLDSMLAQRIKKLPETLARLTVDQVADNPHVFKEWTKIIKKEGGRGGQDTAVVRWMRGPQWNAVRQALGAPDLPPMLFVQDKDLWHTIRDAKAAAQRIPDAVLESLPQELGKVELIVHDTDPKDPAILFIRKDGNIWRKLVFKVRTYKSGGIEIQGLTLNTASDLAADPMTGGKAKAFYTEIWKR